MYGRTPSSSTRAQTSRTRERSFVFLAHRKPGREREGSLGDGGAGHSGKDRDPNPQEPETMTETSELDDSFHVFDTTLRDGAQREGINLTVADKLAIARHLDDFGVGFIEGGWPGANPRDTEFFARAQQEIDFKHAELV